MTHGLVLRQHGRKHSLGRQSSVGSCTHHGNQQGIQGVQQHLPVLLCCCGARQRFHVAAIIAGMRLLRLAWRASSRSVAEA